MDLFTGQVNATLETGRSTFSRSQGDLAHTDNYVVSVFPDRVVVMDGKITRTQLVDFYANNDDLLKRYPDLVVGTWYHDGQTYIDITMVTQSRRQAIDLALHCGQKAILCLKSSEEIFLEKV